MPTRLRGSLTFLGRFTLTSAVLAGLFAVALGAFVSAQVTRAALDEAAAATLQTTDSLLSPYLVRGDFSQPLWPDRLETLDHLMLPHLIQRGILQVRLWSPAAVVVYGNDREQIGTQATPAPTELRRALAGRPAAVVRQVDGEIRSAKSGRVLAVYAPVRLSGDARPEGAFEVILDAAPLVDHIAAARMHTWLYVLAGTGVLYVSLIGLVYRASGTLLQQQRALRMAFEGTVRALAAAIDAKDSYTGGHSGEVSRHAEAIARACGLSEEDIKTVRIAGYLHDLGKIGVPDRVLRKQGPLTDPEWERVREHSTIGHRILDPIPIDERIKLAVRHNHERWDGAGYPDRLAGPAIPIHARILAVADAYEAMTSHRPYRPAMEPETALQAIAGRAGSQFDPEVVRAFVAHLAQAGAHLAHPEVGTVSVTPESPGG